MSKRRPEWKVRLATSNLKPVEGLLTPNVIINRTYTLQELCTLITQGGNCPMSHESLVCAAQLLFNQIEESIVDGYAVNTPIGILSPSVTGTWSANRIQPEERGRNTATVRYTLSPRMKKALANPLFQHINNSGFRLHIYNVEDTATKTQNEVITPGHSLILKGTMLYMNGDLPERGIYFIHAQTAEVACHIRPEELVTNTRTRIILQVPQDLPQGQYLIRVVSQCTTNPKPMKRAVEYTTQTPLTCKHS